MVTIKTLYGKHERHIQNTVGHSLTQQQFKDETNVNNILKKYQKTGLLTHVNSSQPSFGDFSSVEDYQVSLSKIQQAQQSFFNLPSELRNKFHNDPSKLIEFINNPKNDEDSYKYGLKIKPKQDQNLEELKKITEALNKSNDLKTAIK